MKQILFAAPILMLAACGETTNTEVTDVEAPLASNGELAAAAAALPAGDFLDLVLGAKIVGPQGDEVEGALSTNEGNFADIRSFVACPEGMTKCDPKTAPAGTIYTYVHVVYPGEDNQSSTGSGEGNDSSDIERATAFRMIRPAHGFTGTAGYSKDEVLGAIGPKADVAITCDAGELVWTVSAGDGGNQWEQAEPVTFYWQSTLPPAGPADAYAIDANYTQAKGPGPYPAETAGATNACLDESN
ncbi:hypothetical protein [Qipengyuania marisflavi]|uniref:Lipoprotein n=1 Tax=Qipengyuania marisflavi TaxID=2486356 RepID=A0A5S3Q0H1_9SPHN|nr:hypothetical protein [Qipengyuania marisflavi]TMM49827.1 hypothetical protein FEV51_01095 [Qipengyuania marisflavi]